MIQIVLVVLGIFALIRYPKLAKLRAVDFSGVDESLFDRWRSTEKRASLWLIVASIGVLVIQLGGGVALGVALGATHATKAAIERASLTFTIATVALFFLLLVVAAIYGSKAAKLKKEAGIAWPKKP